MSKTKILKIVKIAAAVIVALIIAVCLIMTAVFHFVIKPKSETIVKVLDEVIKDEEILKEIEAHLPPEEVEKILKNLEADQTAPSVEETPDGGEKEPDNKKDTTPPRESDTKKQDTTIIPNNTVVNEKKQRSDYESDYEYVKDNVSASDLSKGLALASKIDVGYVASVVSGGLTIEEKKELKRYLKSRLSSGEIAEGIALYSKYSYLLK